MITYHWDDQEIPSGQLLKTSGLFQIRVFRGSYDFSGYQVIILDPFEIPVLKKEIPTITKGEYWQVSLPLTNYLVKGKYSVVVKKDAEISSEFDFYLQSRKNHQQLFLAETKLVFKQFKKKVNSLQFEIPQLPSSILTQRIGELHVIGADEIGNKIQIDDLLGKTQKTITWSFLVQPSYLPLDTMKIKQSPDEYYVFHRHTYDDEPGLELSEIDLSLYEGSKDIHYPIQVINDVMIHVHRNLKYVRQQKERGLKYALQYGRGDCTEYSAYVVSLLRKLGIRSRLVNGLGRSYYNNWISHAFIEVYLHGFWVPVDTVKPPKPYLTIGNVGDLIATSYNNWLDPSIKELSIKFTAFKDIVPTMEFSRKVTETGVDNLPIKIKNQGIRKFLPHFHSKHLIKINDNILTITLPDDTQGSVFIIEGKKDYGKVVLMQFLPDKKSKIDISNLIRKIEYWICIQNKDEVILCFERISL